MPYKIVSEDDGFYVENAQTGRRMNKKPLTKQRAIRYQRALYANSGDTKMIKHGGLHSVVEKDKLQAIHDHAASMGADCGMEAGKSFKSLKDYTVAGQPVMVGEEIDNPPDDIRSAVYAIASLCALLESEDDEPGDLAIIANTIRGLLKFIESELSEAEAGEDEDDAEKAIKETIPAIVKTEEKKSLNLSYVKSLGIQAPDLAVKYVGRDEIRGRNFLWGNKNMTDVELEYFTKDSNFWDDILGKNPRPLTWDHAQDEDFKAAPIIGQVVDWGDDDLGRWYVAKMDRSHKYRKMIDKLIEEGVLGTSSDSAPQYVVRQKTGKATWLKQWPWFASALTDVPCEPRMIDSLEILKSLGVTLPDTLNAWEWDRERLAIQKSIEYL